MKWQRKRKPLITDEELHAAVTSHMHSDQGIRSAIPEFRATFHDSEGSNDAIMTLNSASIPAPKIRKITVKAKFALVPHECAECRTNFWLCRMWKKWELTDKYMMNPLVVMTARPRVWVSWHCMECGNLGGLRETISSR